MAVNIGDWILETTKTVGTGNITLSGAARFDTTTFSNAISGQTVYYAIQDGYNRESGIGTLTNPTTLVRTQILATLFEQTYNDTNPIPIALSGEAKVGCTFEAQAHQDLIDHISTTSGNPHNVIASEVPYSSIGDDHTNSSDVQSALSDHADVISTKTPTRSSLITGGQISQADAIRFNVADGTGVIIDNYTDVNDVQIIDVTISGNTLIPLNSGGEDVGMTHIFVNSQGVVVQETNAPHPAQLRQYIFIGSISHKNGQIVSVDQAPSMSMQGDSDTYDQMFYFAPIRQSKFNPIDNALQVYNRFGGYYVFPGINWNSNKTNPNYVELLPIGSGTQAATFNTVTRDGLSQGDGIADIPLAYNPGDSTLTDLTGTEATIHQVFSFGYGVDRFLVLLYGQELYPSATEALTHLSLYNSFSELPASLWGGVHVASICVQADAVDFSDRTKAWIHNVTTAMAGGGSIPASQDHSTLTNRDLPDQHPITAISNLRTELDTPDTIVSDTPPPTQEMVNGQEWLNSDTGIKYVWYVDGDGGQWLRID